MILLDFILQNNSHDYDINLLAKNIKNNKNKLIKLYNLINKFTFFDLSKNNYKCSFHGERIKQDKITFLIDDEEFSFN